MTEQTPLPPSVRKEQTDAVLKAYDYALKRYKAECMANWRSPVHVPAARKMAEIATTRCCLSLLEVAPADMVGRGRTFALKT